MTVWFTAVAEAELDDAFRYYEAESPGLGARFLAEVVASLNRIVEFPDAWQELDRDVRRCLVRRFPYGVLYSRKGGDIVVLGIAHAHRKPENWRVRIEQAEF